MLKRLVAPCHGWHLGNIVRHTLQSRLYTDCRWPTWLKRAKKNVQINSVNANVVKTPTEGWQRSTVRDAYATGSAQGCWLLLALKDGRRAHVVLPCLEALIYKSELRMIYVRRAKHQRLVCGVRKGLTRAAVILWFGKQVRPSRPAYACQAPLLTADSTECLRKTPESPYVASQSRSESNQMCSNKPVMNVGDQCE